MGGPWEQYAPAAQPASDGPWTQYAAPAAEPAPMGAVEAFARGAEQGATLGFGDEARGVLAASPMTEDLQGSGPVSRFLAANVAYSPLGLISRGIEGGYNLLRGTPGAREQYEAARDENRGALHQAEAEHPYATLGGTVAGGVAPMLVTGGGGGALAAGGTGGRILTGMATGAGAGGVMGFGQGEGGVGPRVEEAVKGALVGGLLGGAAEGVVGGLRNVASRARGALFPDAATAAPTLTPENVSALRAAGYDPAAIGDEAASSILAQAQAAGGITPGTIRQAGASALDVPLTRGQATGDVRQATFEQAARADARGPIAGNVLRGFDARQAEALGAARDTAQARFAGDGRTLIDGAHDAGASVTDAVRQAATDAEARVGQAYADPRLRGTTVAAEGVSGLGQQARTALDQAAFPVDPVLHPATTRALREVDALGDLDALAASRGAVLNPGERVAGIGLEGLENTRQRLNKLFASASTPADRAGLMTVKRTFDQGVTDAVDGALLSGDPSALAAWKQARGLRAEYADRFQARGAGDDAGKLVERILTRDVTPNEVASWMLGNTTLGASPRSVRFVNRLRDVVGEDSQAWSDVRQAAWKRVTSPGEGKPQPGPGTIASSVGEFLRGRGRDLAEALFTPDERGLMAHIGAAHRSAAGPEISSAGLGAEVGRAQSPWLQRAAGALGMASGHPSLAGAAMTTAKVGGGVRNAINAGRAVQPVTVGQPVDARAAILAGVLGGDQREMVTAAANDRTQALAHALLSGTR